VPLRVPGACDRTQSHFPGRPAIATRLPKDSQHETPGLFSPGPPNARRMAGEHDSIPELGMQPSGAGPVSRFEGSASSS
jgi:hypothetical protein